MKTITIYSLKIKIVNLQFKIRALQPSIVFTLSLGDKAICEYQVEFKNGLLKQNLSLVAQVSQTEINSFSQVTLIISQKKVVKQDSIGIIKLPFKEFMSSKMKKISIKNCFDSSAYIEAFLLLIPQRIVQQQSRSNKKQTQRLSDHSSNKSINSCSRRVFDEKDQITFNEYSKDQSSRKQNKSIQIATQTYNIQTLLNLNEILRENNQKLKQENNYLKTKSRDLEEKINNLGRKIELEQALKGQIEELESKVMQKQFEVVSKDQIIATLKQQKQSLTQQILKYKLKTGNKEEFKIDTIIGELGKYADTAKKYKSKMAMDESRIAIPKLSIVSGQFPKQSMAKTSRNRKEQLRSLLSCAQSRLSDETFDTLKQSIIKKVNP